MSHRDDVDKIKKDLQDKMKRNRSPQSYHDVNPDRAFLDELEKSLMDPLKLNYDDIKEEIDNMDESDDIDDIYEYIDVIYDNEKTTRKEKEELISHLNKKINSLGE